MIHQKNLELSAKIVYLIEVAAKKEKEAEPMQRLK